MLSGSIISAREYFSGDILRDIRGKKLKVKDSAGRISKENQIVLKDTVLKDFGGTILSLFHWTDADLSLKKRFFATPKEAINKKEPIRG